MAGTSLPSSRTRRDVPARPPTLPQATAGGTSLQPRDGQPERRVDAADVVAGLAVGRDAAVAQDGVLAGVVGGKHLGEIAGEHGDEPAQIADAGLQVLLGIVELLLA